jgi:hypothetical protein
MADFNLEALSLKELRHLQNGLARAISTYGGHSVGSTLSNG